jgi:hypothetical protein
MTDRKITTAPHRAPTGQARAAFVRERNCLNAVVGVIPIDPYFWICATITTMSALVSAGFSIAGLGALPADDSSARYAASRSIALFIGAVSGMALSSRSGVAALALTMSLIQGFDGLIGALAHDAMKTYGPFVLSVANLAALMLLLRVANEEGN